ncbi:DUF4176 domain-containing protein [Bombilactobacillus thymidiniphilus]|uniref:DUF4176 domain-containing protein n=1 Tax=Bombilactobacillus thymidiniphilus TaxID=2923363 RepID=A0ABY4PD34_9LACO|nr:DUF4176 domain-containing protein [Bombilactobacillus thymidiniphilus]UQS83187.1 DUF4176 domain-containing protein [Bombilactobacillus thymidiniphilus]
MNDKILPIVSIVTLKNSGNTPVMIVNRTPLYYEKEQCLGYLDYSAVLYPEGLDDPSDDKYYFNREDIANLLFLGYRDPAELEFEQNYDTMIKDDTHHKLTVQDLATK